MIRTLMAAAALAGTLTACSSSASAPGTTSSATPSESPLAPRTALLIPGYGGGTLRLESLAQAFEADDIPAEIIDIGTGRGDLRRYAVQVQARAEALIDAGELPPSLIGYSAGGVTARIAATTEPDTFDRVVTLAAPHHGTTTAELGALLGRCPTACEQLRPDSELLSSLPEPPDPDDWLSIYSQTDEVIRPVDSSRLSGITNIALQDLCDGTAVGHGQVPTFPTTEALAIAFLQREPLPTACVAGPA